ncbi:ATP-binding protein [Streptomyces albidoflavus]
MDGYEDTEPPTPYVLPFMAEPQEVAILRRAVASQLVRWGTGDVSEEVQLIVTELATNVHKHVGRGADATLIMTAKGSRLRVEVYDKSPEVPVPRLPSCDEECGRGLHLLASMADLWGVQRTETGKAVWCEVSLASAPRDAVS